MSIAKLFEDAANHHIPTPADVIAAVQGEKASGDPKPFDHTALWGYFTVGNPTKVEYLQLAVAISGAMSILTVQMETQDTSVEGMVETAQFLQERFNPYLEVLIAISRTNYLE